MTDATAVADVILACFREVGIPEPHRQDGVLYFNPVELWPHTPEMVHRAFAIGLRSTGREPQSFDEWVEASWEKYPKCRAWLRHHGYDLDAPESA